MRARPYIWYAERTKMVHDAVDRIAMPPLGTFYDAIKNLISYLMVLIVNHYCELNQLENRTWQRVKKMMKNKTHL